MKILLRMTASVLLVTALAGQQARQASELITPDDLKAHIFFLASDELRGRSAGSEEDHVATEYIASEFLRLGLKPMGDGGSYFQKMEIDTGNLDREHTTLSSRIGGTEHTYAMGKDFRWSRQSLKPASACGDVVFAGYGIDAPEYGYDDFSGVDVKGKVVMILGREPQANDPSSRFMGTWDTYHAFYWQKLEEARKHGAAGLLIVQDRIPRDVKTTPASAPRASGGPNFALAGPMWDIITFSISRDVADQLLAPARKTVDELQAAIDRTVHPQSMAIASSNVCMAKAYTNLERHEGRNVAAMLEGSDPQLKSEVVLLTAHHDHMGTQAGRIYHGADDNASGVAGLLETARAFVRGAVRPKRSVLFVSYDGEERIFLGSYFYVTHPLVQLDRTVANFNLDMIGRDENDANWPVPPDRNVNMVNILGTRYNPGLRSAIEKENARIGLKLDYKMDTVDPDSLWSRSDQFWFATLHIPQVEFQTGLHPDYHTEHDTWDRIDYPKLTKIARLVFLSVDEVANMPGRIAFQYR